MVQTDNQTQNTAVGQADPSLPQSGTATTVQPQTSVQTQTNPQTPAVGHDDPGAPQIGTVSSAVQFQSGDQTSAIGQMQSSSQIQTSEQASTHKPGAQYYIEVGGFGKKAAQAAGAVLDKILNDEVTWQTLTNSDIDKLKLTTSQGAKAVSLALDVIIPKALTQNDARNAIRYAAMHFSGQNQAPLGIDMDISDLEMSTSDGLNGVQRASGVSEDGRAEKNQNAVENLQESDIIDIQKNFHHVIKMQKGMNEAYQHILCERFANGHPNVMRVMCKFISADTVADSSYVGKAHFDSIKRKIYMDFSADQINLRGKGSTFFHEHGHYIDFMSVGFQNAVWLSRKYRTFGDIIRYDFESYVGEIKRTYGITKEEAYARISKEIKGDTYHSISDIIGGITGNQCVGTYGHKPAYWWKPGALEKECFAHMVEASFDRRKYSLLKKYFPNAVEEFERLLKELI